MSVDGARTDDELVVDLCVDEALGEETEYRDLAFGQVGRGGCEADAGRKGSGGGLVGCCRAAVGSNA